MPPSKRNRCARSAPALLTLLPLLLLPLSIAQFIGCQPPHEKPHLVPVSRGDGEVAIGPSKSTPTPAAAKLNATEEPATLDEHEEQRGQQTPNGVVAAEEGRRAEGEPIAHELASTKSAKHGTQDNESAASQNATTTEAATATPPPPTATTTTTTTPSQSESGPASTSGASSDTSNGTAGITSTTQKPAAKPQRIEVECDNLCLNGGRCVVLDTGEMVCQCVVPFFGSRCQHRDICKSVIADQLNGDQICERIGRQCLQDDKLFRCACDVDEFFVFKADYQPSQTPFKATDSTRQTIRQPTSTFAYDSLLPLQATPTPGRFGSAGESATEQQRLSKSNSFGAASGASGKVHPNKANANKYLVDEPANSKQTYLAECRKIDKCLGVRCRQTSEICQDGACVCNRNAGYIQDPVDKLCKLLDPCQLATGDGLPRCGQAKCVATYDRELYKCVCPVGYKPVKVGEHRSSIQCALLSNQLCEIPLLNNCQHVCKIDRKANTYKCSCLPGYRPGTRPGLDDNMCFFDEHLGEPSAQEADDYSRSRTVQRIKTDDEPRPRHRSSAEAASASNDGLFSYDPTPEAQHERPATTEAGQYRFTPVEAERRVMQLATGRRNLSIRREPWAEKSGLAADRLETTLRSASANELDDQEDESDYDRYGDLNNMSVQDRCNMYCEPNKICVLEEGSHDSYMCVCDRQGYVSVGDKCLDWCSAAEFSHSVQSLLAEVCYSGICKQADTRPVSPSSGGGLHLQRLLDKLPDQVERERVSALAKSSWRPAFQCDCSTSPLLLQDAHTGLCKLHFDAILRPCLPGNEGYTDCVINKHSYCSVLHRPTQFFFRDLFAEQIFDNQLKTASGAAGNASSSGAGEQAQQQKSAPNKKLRPKEKLYTCVCSPEKKFLVDKPRNKARCIHECDLLNNECGRFNRMCRPATIESIQDFGFNWNLVKFDRDGVRMNQFKRTGCECLPGFNVGPTEARDFTLDDNYPEKGAHYEASFTSGVWPPTPDVLAMSEQANRWQLADAFEIFQEPALSADVNALLPAEFAGSDFEHLRTKYININSRCLLDYDVVEFHASFKAPASFEPAWVKVRNTKPLIGSGGSSELKLSNESRNETGARFAADAADRPHVLKIPAFMRADISEFHRHAVLVAQCDSSLAQLSFEAYRKCLRYRYWVVQKLRRHFSDWRRVISRSLKETFDLMDGNIRFRVNKCEATIKRIATIPRAFSESIDQSGEFPDLAQMRDSIESRQQSGGPERQPAASNSDSDSDSNSKPATKTSSSASEKFLEMPASVFDPLDPFAKIDADLDCELTIHSASDDSGARQHARKVLLEKQLPKFIFSEHKLAEDETFQRLFNDRPLQTTNATDEASRRDYYLMAPNTLIRRESFDQLGQHRKLFSPCKSDYAYCDKQTRCEMVDTVNYSCTCDYGYTPIGSRDIYFGDSRKEVCEDINECLFDVCKENGLENKSVCVNEIGDYKCQCTRHHVGDNKRYCNHICNVIACKYGDCRIPDEHHAFCECHEGYREADCSVLDPSVALRKANMIICGSIFTSVLLLAVTLAISLNSQLKKTKKKLKRLEAAQDAAEFLEFNLQQAPFSRQRVSKASIAS